MAIILGVNFQCSLTPKRNPREKQILNGMKKCGSCVVCSYAQHIVPQLSEGTWWSSDSVMYFLGSTGAKDLLPGHQRLIDRPLPESQIINPQAMNPDIKVNKQTKQYTNRAILSVFYRSADPLYGREREKYHKRKFNTFYAGINREP